MNINKVINYTTCSFAILNMRLVIGQSRFKIDSRANSLKVTSNTMSEINNIPRRTGQRFTTNYVRRGMLFISLIVLLVTFKELALLSILNLDWPITSRVLSITKEHVV